VKSKKEAPAGGGKESRYAKKKSLNPNQIAEKVDISSINATLSPCLKMSDTMMGVQSYVVKSGEILQKWKTDKATMELESYEDGTLFIYWKVEAGEQCASNGVIAVIGEKGADFLRL